MTQSYPRKFILQIKKKKDIQLSQKVMYSKCFDHFA